MLAPPCFYPKEKTRFYPPEPVNKGCLKAGQGSQNPPAALNLHSPNLHMPDKWPASRKAGQENPPF